MTYPQMSDERWAEVLRLWAMAEADVMLDFPDSETGWERDVLRSVLSGEFTHDEIEEAVNRLL